LENASCVFLLLFGNDIDATTLAASRRKTTKKPSSSSSESLFLSLLPSFTAQSFAGSLVVGTTTTTFRSRGYRALTFWADNEKEKARFFVKKSIQSRFHSSMHSLLGGGGGYLCFLLLFFSRAVIFCTHKKSAREALDTPPREAGIPSLARETHRLIVFARGFFGEEDKETEKRKF